MTLRCPVPAWPTLLTRSKNEHRRQLQALQRTWREHVQVMHSFVLSQDPPKAHGWVGTQFSITRLTGWLNKTASLGRRAGRIGRAQFGHGLDPHDAQRFG